MKAKNEKLRAVTQAEAKAEEQKLIADAVAYEIEVESKARAEAIKRESEALAGNLNSFNYVLQKNGMVNYLVFQVETLYLYIFDNLTK